MADDDEAAHSGPGPFTPSPRAWTWATLGLWALVLATVFAYFVFAIWPQIWTGKLLAFGVILSLPVFITLGLVLLHAGLSGLPARFRVSLFVALPVLVLLGSLPVSMPARLGISVGVLLALSFVAGGLASLFRGPGSPGRALLSGFVFLIGAAGLGGLVYGLVTVQTPQKDEHAGFRIEDRTLGLADPSFTGPYGVIRHSYGSGTDRHRPSFADGADWTSRSVDGSKLIDNWDGPVGWIRSRFWGFDDTALPVQGRVWVPDAPEADGPFPLVLIVHGNHAMEDFSDPGYAYLGEHFASRGYIAVSVDENFLNSSIAEIVQFVGFDFGRPGLREENDARGWMLLEHLAQWREWTADPDHPMAGKADLDRVVLIGHSRGGEAVAVASHFNTLSHYPDDGTVTFDYGFGIRGAIAIAPVDGQYKPRSRGTPLASVNYFVIHGSMDGDVASFMGASQYTRTDVSGPDPLFKASLYVDGANHGQFNTLWGRTDAFGLSAFFLRRGAIMDGEAQRRIAKVYFSAFLDIVTRNREGYRPLFTDVRRGATWLPDTFMINNYQASDTQLLADFEEDGDLTTGAGGVAITAEKLSRWQEDWIRLKWRPLESHAVLLAWDARISEEPARYALRWDPAQIDGGTDRTSVLRFSAARSKTSSLPDDWETEDEEAGEEEDTAQADDEPDLLDWTVILRDAEGREASLPLSHDQALHPQVEAQAWRLQGLSSTPPSEIVFRRYAFRVTDFLEQTPELDVTSLAGVEFVFDQSEKGAVLIDDVGLARRY